MASELYIDYPTGSTLYLRLSQGTSFVKASDGTLFTANSTNWTNAAVVGSDSTLNGHYLFSIPSGLAAGVYAADIFIRAGVSAATTDTRIGGPANVNWTGSAILSLPIVLPANVAPGSQNGLLKIGANTGHMTLTGDDTNEITLKILGAPGSGGSDGGQAMFVSGGDGNAGGSGGNGLELSAGSGGNGSALAGVLPANFISLSINGSGQVVVSSFANNAITAASIAADADTEIAAAVQTGLTAQGYTTTRAPKLDYLDAAVSTSGGSANTAQLDRIEAQANKITTQRIEAVSHVNNQDVTINQGETYSSTLNSLTFAWASGDSWPTDLTAYTIAMTATQRADTDGNVPTSPATINQAGVVVVATGSTRSVRIDATAAQTAAFAAGVYDHKITATSGSTVDVLRQGQLRVVG
jgi:hypothetical protein